MAATAESPTRVRARAGDARRRRSGVAPLERQQRRLFWPFVGPAVAVYGVLFLAPIGYAAWTSLYKWNGIGAKTWAGFGNYRTLIDDPVFHTSLTNTLKILFVAGGITFVLAFALTLALREMKGRFFARSALFFPSLINGMVFGAAAGFLFAPDGPINTALVHLGMTDPPKWLAQENIFPLIMATLIWSGTGYYTSILMAAVDQIPEYLYEAAELEGASAFQRFRYITLPLSWDVVSVCAVLWTVSSVKIFEIVLLFGGSSSGFPSNRTWTTAMYVYTTAFPTASVPELGLATAAAIVSLVMVALFTVVLRRLMRRDPIVY
ncbi:carbohydrate ABC transporter permease [Kitasatospora sp. NPDC058201]|uniref:carbohydrate ABC transporter permease n=1 Tax=unclassified Kitasatospora TaxID=2633591 RepID=UPI00365573D1